MQLIGVICRRLMAEAARRRSYNAEVWNERQDWKESLVSMQPLRQ